MLNKWKCPKCHRTTTEYQSVCQGFDCDGGRNYLQWLLNIDNPALWVGGGLLVLSLVILFLGGTK